jgi:DNA-binding NarL/FixJ family response regulator
MEMNPRPAEQSAKPGDIRVLIVDDHKIVADAIVALLKITDGFQVVGQVNTPAEVLEVVERQKPQVIVTDLEMPGGDPLEKIAQVMREYPKMRVLVLTAYPTDAHIARALKLGVHGFMTKHEPAETVVDGIRAIMAGHAIYSDEVHSRLVSSEQREIKPEVLQLSPRELTVVRMVAQGMTTPQIAESLLRSPKTVDNQIASAMAKTSSANRVELSRWAIREGLVQA